MHYHSTVDKKRRVTFREAVLSGIASDGGLYMPERIPVLPDAVLGKMPDMSLPEIAFEVARPFVQPLEDDVLEQIIRESLSFPAPLIDLSDTLKVLELWHGPTLAFKDFGARFLARMLSRFLADENKEILVLVATSGDTGSAVANGFYGMPGIKVGLLYPGGKVSRIQEQQLTTVGGNVQAFEVAGSFDDCQKLVKQAFSDRSLSGTFYLTSANSINICRLLPQMFYSFYAGTRPAVQGKPLTVCIPSGNFGNLTAGLMAWKMGLAVDHFIAAVNVNRVFPAYLETGVYTPARAVATLSNAMDVGDPSNFQRIRELFHDDIGMIRRYVSSYSIDDDATIAGIREMWTRYGYLIDPHGAVGFQAIRQHMAATRRDGVYILMETAHPAKFKDSMQQAVETEIIVPDRLAEVLEKEKSAVRVGSNYADFREKLVQSTAGK